MAKTSPSDRLLTDLHQVVTDAESLLRATADQTSAGASNCVPASSRRWTAPSPAWASSSPWRSNARGPPARRPTTTCATTRGNRSAWRPVSAC